MSFLAKKISRFLHFLVESNYLLIHSFNWKSNSDGRTALLIEGARRVGKTTVIKEFAKKEYRSFTSSFYSHIPSFLSARNKLIKFSAIRKGGRYASLASSLDGIEKSMTGNICQNSSDPSIGLSLTAVPSDIKIYNSDTGLLISQVLSDNEITTDDIYKKLILNKLSINQGRFFENSVSQALRASGHALYFHTFDSEQKKYEIDFLVQEKGKIIPIEVKSSSYNRHISLDLFLERNKGKKNIGQPIIIYTKDLKVENGILYLPIYMTGLI